MGLKSLQIYNIVPLDFNFLIYYFKVVSKNPVELGNNLK